MVKNVSEDGDEQIVHTATQFYSGKNVMYVGTGEGETYEEAKTNAKVNARYNASESEDTDLTTDEFHGDGLRIPFNQTHPFRAY